MTDDTLDLDPGTMRGIVQRAAAAVIAPALSRLQDRVDEAERKATAGVGPEVARHLLQQLETHLDRDPENAEFYGALSQAIRSHAHSRFPEHGFSRDAETGEVVVTAQGGAKMIFASRDEMTAFRRKHRDDYLGLQWFGPGHTITQGRGAKR